MQKPSIHVPVAEGEVEDFRLLRSNFRAKEQKLLTLSEADLSKLIRAFEPLIEEIQTHFCTTFERNHEVFPVVF